MPRTARAAVGDYCYYVINPGNARAVAFWIGRLDEPMAASRNWWKRRMSLFFSLGVLKLLSFVLLGSLFDESGGPVHASLQHAGSALGTTSTTER